MRTGFVFLVLGYVLSQFYRAFLAVLAPELQALPGVGAEDLARASGLWFLAFALAQLPVGWALDRVGPRLTAAVLLGVGGAGGAAVMALAQGPLAIDIAMMLIGLGCAPVLMAAYYIFARAYPPAAFGTLAGLVVGIGSIGNIVSALPLAWAVGAFGWRGTIWALAAATLLIAMAIARALPDLPRPTGDERRGSVIDLLRMPGLWLVIPMLLVAYGPAAGLRGLWVGPYLGDIFGATKTDIGQATLVMGLAMIAGSFAYGPLDRLTGSRKWGVFGGNFLALCCLVFLVLRPGGDYWAAVALLAALGFFGASFPAIMAHGRSFVPPHLLGRGVTLLNLFSIGGAGILQMASGRVHAAAGGAGSGAYQALFLFFALALAAGLAVYAFSEDRRD